MKGIQDPGKLKMLALFVFIPSRYLKVNGRLNTDFYQT